jgi:hypothetical protein
MGEQLGLGAEAKHGTTEQEQGSSAISEILAEREPDFWFPTGSEDQQQEWKTIVAHLASALDGDADETLGAAHAATCRLRAWVFEARPILEHAIVYACCKSGDTESLCLARSICGQGVSLRPNSPEEWWRYSIVLGLLGDEVASEDALNLSINVGAGQGARRV